jgi:hypothetical protein
MQQVKMYAKSGQQTFAFARMQTTKMRQALTRCHILCSLLSPTALLVDPVFVNVY